MPILLGLGASMSYGVADFLGGVVSRHRPALTIALLSQLVGLAVLLAASLLFLRDPVTVGALAWGASSGMAGAVGLVALYRGLAKGHMAVVAPVAAMVGAIGPVAFGLLTGEAVSPVALAGVVVALIAVGLVSWTSQTRRGPRGARACRPAPAGLPRRRAGRNRLRGVLHPVRPRRGRPGSLADARGPGSIRDVARRGRAGPRGAALGGVGSSRPS